MSAKRRHTHYSCRKVQAPRLGSDLQPELTRVLFEKSTLQELKLSKRLQPDIQQRFVLVRKQHPEARASPVSPSVCS